MALRLGLMAHERVSYWTRGCAEEGFPQEGFRFRGVSDFDIGMGGDFVGHEDHVAVFGGDGLVETDGERRDWRRAALAQLAANFFKRRLGGAACVS